MPKGQQDESTGINKYEDPAADAKARREGARRREKVQSAAKAKPNGRLTHDAFGRPVMRYEGRK